MGIESVFRNIKNFKGKTRLAHILFKKKLDKMQDLSFTGKRKIHYSVPNTVDAIGKDLFINGIYEPDTINLISSLVNKNGFFFDVGANIGAICIPVSKITNCNVHAFEASSKTFSFLYKNVQSNRLNNIKTINKAVHSSHNLMIDFYHVDDKHGGSSLVETYGPFHESIYTVSLDAYCEENNINEIDVLKIDVQGFEIEVIKGCMRLLDNKSVKHILFEFEDWAEKHAGFDLAAAQIYLIEKGYSLYTLDNQKIDNPITKGSAMIWAKLESDR